MFDWENVSKTFQLPEQTIQLLNKIQLGLVISKPEPRTTHGPSHRGNNGNNHKSNKSFGERSCSVGYSGTPGVKLGNTKGTRADSDVFKRGTHFTPELRPKPSSGGAHIVSPVTTQPKVKPTTPINHLATVQASLNKLTEKNYDSQLVIIIGAHASLLEEAEAQIQETKPMTLILDLIFRTASSGIHARLIDDLAKVETPEHTTTPNQHVSDHIIVVFEKFDADVSGMNTDPIDPVTDYDEFCRVTKQNDRCRATASFFIHLADKQLISPVYIVVLLRKWLDRVTIIVELPDKLTEVEMVSELVSRFAPILAKKDIGTCKDNRSEVEAEHCRAHIRNIQQFKVSEKKSFSSRVLFKYKDMANLFTKS
jgi:hypothetical protein